MRWLKYFAGGIVLLLVWGAIFQTIASSRSLHHPPGALVDVGGYRMHLYCAGQGGPAVILDSGLGDSWLAWKQVQPQVAGFTRVCSYDRAGMGWSDPSPRARTSKDIAIELHTLLHNAPVDGPYILVGHSAGGINVRVFRDLYPGEVKAMVLVDASHPDQIRRLPESVRKYEGEYMLLARALEYAIPTGIPRLAGLCPPGATAECSPASLAEALDEYAAFPASLDQARAAAPLGNLPLRVISRDPSSLSPPLTAQAALAVNRVWEQLQDELAALSTDSRRVVATGSGHIIPSHSPALVADTIRELVQKLAAPDPKTAAP